MKTKVKIKPLEIKIYNKGICFICGKECEKDHYAHYECCLAYAENKELKLKELNEESP